MMPIAKPAKAQWWTDEDGATRLVVCAPRGYLFACVGTITDNAVQLMLMEKPKTIRLQASGKARKP